MNILIVSATKFEVAPLLLQMSLCKEQSANHCSCSFNHHQIDFVFTGVGMVATAYHTAKALNANYDLAINLGICGSFNKNIELGSVVNIYEDRFSELGAEDDKAFLTLNELNLPGVDLVSNTSNTFFSATIDLIPKVTAITVNTTHGNDASIENVFSRFHPYVESMEGAAFMYVCEQEGVRCIQLRSVSNYVERRNKDAWNISLAIDNLNKKALEILNEFH